MIRDSLQNKDVKQGKETINALPSALRIFIQAQQYSFNGHGSSHALFHLKTFGQKISQYQYQAFPAG